MRHWLYTRLAALSFVLFLIALAAWIHGYFNCDSTGWYRYHWTTDYHLLRTQILVGSGQGKFEFYAAKTDGNWSLLLSPSRTKPLTPQAREAISVWRTGCPEMASWLTYSLSLAEAGHTPQTLREFLRQSFIGIDRLVIPDHHAGGAYLIPAGYPILLLSLLPLHWLERRLRRKTFHGFPVEIAAQPPLIPSIAH